MKKHHHLYLIALCLLAASLIGMVVAKEYVLKPSPQVPQTAAGLPKVNFPSAVPYFVTPPPDSKSVKVYSPVLQHQVYVRVAAAKKLGWYSRVANVPNWVFFLLGMGIGALAHALIEHRRHHLRTSR